MKDKPQKLYVSFLSLLLASVITILGWFILSNLAAKRDRINKQRDLRVEYLIGAYSKLANASWRDPESGTSYYADVETAMADIQLFGTDSQIAKAKKIMDDFQRTRCSSLDELLRDLRDDLRYEMDLSKIEGNVQWFRPEGAPTHIPMTKKNR